MAIRTAFCYVIGVQMSNQYYRCACPHCAQDIEYPEDLSAQVINCPSCQQSLTLPEKPFSEEKRESVVTSFFRKIKDAGQAVADKRSLKKLLFESVEDGELTSEEIAAIRSFMQQSGISEDIFSEWGQELFKKAVDSITLTSVSDQQLEAVEEIKHFLRLPDSSLTEELRRLNRWRYILQIRRGNLPPVQVENIILRKDEVAYWIQPAKLWEERVVSRRYEGGSAGISFRVAKGITLRTGSTRGHLITDSADVPVTDGNFIITNQRFIFQGEGKSFETKYEKILDIHNHLDGIRYSESNKQKPRKIQYLSSNGDIIVEILSRIFRDS
jgi:hypothetical protein